MQQIRIAAGQPQLQEQQNSIIEWEKLRQAQDQLIRNQNQGLQQPFAQQDALVKQEESKKPDFPERLAENADSENPKFNFALNAQADKQSAEKHDDAAGQQQSTYTQFIRMNPVSQQNLAQQFQQKNFQEAEKPSHSNFTILQQHSIVKHGSFNQLRNPTQDTEADKQLPFDGDINKPLDQDNKQSQIQEMIMKQKLYQQMLDQQNQMQSANEANLDARKEELIGSQIQQLINAQKNNQPLIASQILAQAQRKPLPQKKHMFNTEELVKKLYEVKENVENDPEYVVNEHENGVSNYTGQLHQKFDLKPAGDHVGEVPNGPNELEQKPYETINESYKQVDISNRNMLLNAMEMNTKAAAQMQEKLNNQQHRESENPQ